MEDYYNTLLKHLDGYTVMGLFDGKRHINEIVTLQTGHKGRIFFFDQEPMVCNVDDQLWDYIFEEPTIFANSELDSTDKEYVKKKYPNFIDWYYFSNALLAREWFSPHCNSFAGWTAQKQTVLDCNLINGPRHYRVYLIYLMYRFNYQHMSYISFNGEYNWGQEILDTGDYMNLLGEPKKYLNRIPKEKISYDNWGRDQASFNGLMQSRIPLDFYSKVNYITVSETLCTENKKHLTEKVFKPIAAGKPFLLVAGRQNLKYLKNYGFKTFDSLWSEEYDNIADPRERIDSIFSLMDTINLDKTFKFEEGSAEHQNACDNIKRKLNSFDLAHTIALENRKYFWSDEFYNLLINEALSNLDMAKKELASKSI